ncbi:MAG: PD-(D/E)XK nuclease family protein [Methanobrevibacter sp.]|jgi:hypothetical protein|nr:PD-(D/E)XK nuclease family protein [Methanobrevibacter sp.]
MKKNMDLNISSKNKDTIIPEYNLTGDILSFLTCNLQYRYQNRESLPPSRPLQLWFGEFVHGVMEQAYTEWNLNKTPFPWNWKNTIRPIEEKIEERMETRGLYPPHPRYYSSYRLLDEKTNENIYNKDPKKRIISTRIEEMLNLWGKELFPLMSDVEVKIKALRKMPNFKENSKSIEDILINDNLDNEYLKNDDLNNNDLNNCDLITYDLNDRDLYEINKNKNKFSYYSISGVVDVISSLNCDKAKTNSTNMYQNLVIKYLKKNKEIDKILKNPQIRNSEVYRHVDEDFNIKTNNKNQANNKNQTENNEKTKLENGLKNDLKSNLENEFEIIIDYKGMMRPKFNSKRWKEHEDQILTYSWLRSRLNNSKPIIAGIIFYINELLPSAIDLKYMKKNIHEYDIKAKKMDLKKILNWDDKQKKLDVDSDYVDTFPVLSENFRLDRSIRVIKIDETAINKSLKTFDNVVSEIEKSIYKESISHSIKSSWKPVINPQTCDVCDFKTFCSKYKIKEQEFKIP